SEVGAAATVLLVVFQAEEPELAQARPDRPRHPARRFPLLDVRHDLALDELPHRRAEHLVLLVEDLHKTTLSSAGFAGAILVLGEASEGAVEAPADFISCCSLKIFTSETLLHIEPHLVQCWIGHRLHFSPTCARR